MGQSKERYRLQYKFWLDINKPDEEALADAIEILKNRRTFTQFVRDGIRLLWDLQQGNTAVLFELFPWVAERVHPPMVEHDGGMVQALLDRLDAIQAELEKQQKSAYADNSSASSKLGQPKALAVPSMSKPVFDDDDDDLLTLAKDTSTESARNFLDSAFNLQK